MKILVAANMGYVGPPVISQLGRSYPDATIIGMCKKIISNAQE